MFIAIRYQDRELVATRVEVSSNGSVFQSATIHNAGSTAATLDYQVEFEDCTSGCVHTLQTKTK